jgi:hypothetical protein
LTINNSAIFGNAIGSAYTGTAASEDGTLGANDCMIVVGAEKDSSIYQIRSIVPCLMPLHNGVTGAQYFQSVPYATTGVQNGLTAAQARLSVLRCKGGKIPTASPLNPNGTTNAGTFDLNKYDILFDTFIAGWGAQQFTWNYHPENEDDIYGLFSLPFQPLIVALTNYSYWIPPSTPITIGMTGILNVQATKRKGGATAIPVAGNYKLGDI